jgi:amino acid permease
MNVYTIIHNYRKERDESFQYHRRGVYVCAKMLYFLFPFAGVSNKDNVLHSKLLKYEGTLTLLTPNYDG